MSFTQDELQAFNTILEQKLATHRRELELSLDQRMNMLRQELEQYLAAVQQNLLYHLPLSLSDQQNELKNTVSQYLETYQAHVSEGVNHGDANVAEIQAEISWEDLMGVIDKVVSDRLSLLEGSIQTMFRNTERSLLTQLHSLQSNLMQIVPQFSDTTNANMTDIQDVFTSIEQLERIIESLQVAMTANHTLLSNRLYHHQHLPLERAHPAQPSAQPSTNESGVQDIEEQL